MTRVEVRNWLNGEGEGSSRPALPAPEEPEEKGWPVRALSLGSQGSSPELSFPDVGKGIDVYFENGSLRFSFFLPVSGAQIEGIVISAPGREDKFFARATSRNGRAPDFAAIEEELFGEGLLTWDPSMEKSGKFFFELFPAAE